MTGSTDRLPRQRSGSSPGDPSTTELLARADAGDQRAWDELVDRYTNLLWSVARSHRLGTADAADVVQATWLRLVEHLGRIEDPERLAGWLATTARRECLRTLRRGGREPLGTADDVAGQDDALVDADPPVEAGLLTAERDRLLFACVQALPERCRVLLRVLAATPPPAYAEVSAALDMPIGSIGPIRGRCLAKLRTLAERAGLDETWARREVWS